jgi:hypothetical protein
MAETATQSVVSPQTKRNAVDIVFGSLMEAATSAFLVWALGGVAIRVASGFAGQMIPAPPPGFAPGTNGHGAQHPGWWRAAQGCALGLVFGIFLAHSLWLGFRGVGAEPRHRALRMLGKLREHWFGLIVGNAITAWVAALLLNMIPSFSFTQIFWHYVWSIFVSDVKEAGRSVFGSANTSEWSHWWGWYQGNQSKLYFWLLYVAGAMDDLGIPNYKTWWRWYWRHKRNKDAVEIGKIP